MNGVLGMTSLLESTKLDEEQKEFLETIKISGNNLLMVINDVLDYSKIESGNIKFKEQPLSLEQVIVETLDILAPNSEEKMLELIYFIDNNANNSVYGDAFRLRQILLNLVANAIKFTEKGEIFIHVSAGNERGDGTVMMRFTVSDTGIGISENDKSKLFKVFSQVDSSNSRRYEGTGLGLAICSKLVEAMSGSIGVESEPGKGSDFYFEIPLKPLKENKPVAMYGQKQAVLIDDNEMIRKYLALQLKKWNICTECFGKGNEGLEWLKENPADVIFLDQNLPGENSLELAGEMRKLKGNARIVLMGSLFTSKRYFPENVIDEYISKPLKYNHIYVAMKKLLYKPEAQEKERITADEPANEETFGRKLKLLVAEDNVFNQKLSAAKENGYDIIFMDIQMPEMDGIEAMKIIQQDMGSKSPVIIAMTANNMEGDREKYLAAGMDDYIPKPINMGLLGDLLKYWGKYVLLSAKSG
jgi:CheY-like chemotaxis protein